MIYLVRLELAPLLDLQRVYRGAYGTCWVDAETGDIALRIAEESLLGAGWRPVSVLLVEDAEKATAPSNRCYVDQAVTDGVVVVVDTFIMESASD